METTAGSRRRSARASTMFVALGCALTSCAGGVAPTVVPSSTAAPRARDGFGVEMLYPTAPHGREWHLPPDADVARGEWQPESRAIARVSEGVFHAGGQVRLDVHSPAGKAWWRDVELTACFRKTGDVSAAGGEQHWALFARGERHDDVALTGDRINDGVPAPAGTPTWPGYPYGGATINARCLGTAYYGSVYASGQALLKKEISHAGGYTAERGTTAIDGLAPELGRWFGVKYVVRNSADGSYVHLELWVDRAGDGKFAKVAETDDTARSWPALSGALDGCGAAPFRYEVDQLLSWAGPWVGFRSDGMAIDFKWLSAREISPLP